MTIISFAGVFAGLGIGGDSGSYGSSALLVLGVWSGSMLWWLLLCGAVDALRERLHLDRLGFINKLAGLVLAVFGAMALASAV